MSQETRIDLYLTPSHDCGYFKDRRAASLVVDPQITPSQSTFSILTERGFRRSGNHIYRPHCSGCDDCHPLRVSTNRFQPNRSQRRCTERFKHLKVKRVAPEFDNAHYKLFERYILSRHAGGGMDDDVSPESYERFLVGDVCQTFFTEFHDEGRLVGVAVMDTLMDGLSAVYTYFDPDPAYSGLGTYAILWQIEEAKRQHSNWLYLGYWIPDSPKMNYKNRFKPTQVLQPEGWQDQ